MRTVAGCRHGGCATVQLRRGAKRVSRTWWRVPRFHAVRGHPVLIRVQFLAGPPDVRFDLRHLSASVLRTFLAHARIAALPVQPRTLLGRQIGPHVRSTLLIIAACVY